MNGRDILPACLHGTRIDLQISFITTFVPHDLWRLHRRDIGLFRRQARHRADAHARRRHRLSVPGADHRHHRHPRAGRAQHLSSPSSWSAGPCMRGWRGPRCWWSGPKTTSWRRRCWASARRASSSATRCPTSSTPRIVFAMVDFVLNILLRFGPVSFLGLGVAPPEPEWGAMIAESKDYMRQAWWVTTMPALRHRPHRHGAKPDRRWSRPAPRPEPLGA